MDKRRNLIGAASAAAFALALSLPGLSANTLPPNANQKVPSGEVLRWVYSIPFPISCGDAAQAARDLRAKPATDAQTMHGVMHAYYECATGPYGQNNTALYNTAMFGFAGAALLASRHEGPPLQLKDANYAREVSHNIVNFNWDQVRSGPGVGQPSAYRTNSYRINEDAKSLIAAIKAQPAAPAHAGAAPAMAPAMGTAAPAMASPAPAPSKM